MSEVSLIDAVSTQNNILQKDISKSKKKGKGRLKKTNEDYQSELLVVLSTLLNCPNKKEQIKKLGNLQIDALGSLCRIVERKQSKQTVEFNMIFEREMKQTTQIYNFELLQTLGIEKAVNSISVMSSYYKQRQYFEQSITTPYECLHFTYNDKKIQTISKKMNDLYLKMMGINFQILDHYVSQYFQLPICWNLFETFKILEQSDQYYTQLINYSGERFIAQLSFRKFVEYNKDQTVKHEYYYIVFDLDRKWLNVETVKNNYLNYFQLTNQNQQSQELQIFTNKIDKFCGVKKIV